jgi:hypothetical protein
LETIINWLVSIMIAVAPLGAPSYIPEAKETAEERQARYESFARDLVEVAFDEDEQPLYGGKNARAFTALTQLAVATFESRLRRDVDFGKGKYAKGDGGKSWCPVQIQLGKARPSNGKTPLRIVLTSDGGFEFTNDPDKGFGGEDLVGEGNRKNCLRAGLHIMRRSFGACRSLPVQDRLRAYASGSCSKGSKESQARMNLAIRWMTQKAPPMADAEIIDLLRPKTDEDSPVASALMP